MAALGLSWSLLTPQHAPAQAQPASGVNFIAPPVVVAQPVDQTADYGADVAFTVTASGTPLGYQWRKNGTDLADYGNVAGAHSAQLTLVGMAQLDEADYSVVVSNSAGAVTSAVATLTLNFAPVFSDDFESGLSNWMACSDLPGLAAAWRQYLGDAAPTQRGAAIRLDAGDAESGRVVP